MRRPEYRRTDARRWRSTAARSSPSRSATCASGKQPALASSVAGWAGRWCDCFPVCRRTPTISPRLTRVVCHIDLTIRVVVTERARILAGCGRDRLNRSKEIALAQLHAVVPQDVVSGRDVKEHVWNRPALQKCQPFELGRALARRHADVALFGAVHGRRGDALQV